MNNKKLLPFLKSLFAWPIILVALLVIMDIYVLIINTEAGVVTSVFVCGYIIMVVVIFLIKRKYLINELVRFGVSYSNIQRKLSSELEFAHMVIDHSGCILWVNDAFAELVGEKPRPHCPVADYLPEITVSALPEGNEPAEINLSYKDRTFRVKLENVSLEGGEDDSYWTAERRLPTNRSDTSVVAVYMYDETQLNKMRKDLHDQEIVVGLLYIDNYDEVLESLEDVRRSLFSALVDRKINKFFQNYDAVVKKLEKDKYIVFMQYQYMEQLKLAKFPILDEIRNVNIGNDLAGTISMGIGVHAGTYNRAYEYAHAAIDLALGRGGDQVVIKGGENLEYFGAKTSSVEKNTTVKSRIKAHALKDIIEGKDKILIMGHALGDIDSFGSAVGIYRIAASLNKEAHIVLGEVTGNMRIMVDKFRDSNDYTGMIITPQEALELIDAMSLLVIVDVNRTSYTESPELVEKAKSIVVLDHHRQSGEGIENASLSYVEPSAASACEIVAEIIQYIGEGFKLKQLEADAMFAGIMIDSNNFMTKTSIRTFEAAAFLKRSGADVTRIRKMFRANMPEYVAKARAIGASELYLDAFAIAVCDAADVDSPTVLGAQIANELMEINKIKASFVFTEYNSIIYISARSIDEVNVQVIMEKLGGGGHMSVAGAQLADCKLEDAITKVKEVLKSMTEEGDV